MDYNYDIANFQHILRDFALRSSFVLELGPAKGDGSTRFFEEGLNESDHKDKLFITVDWQDYMEVKPKSPYWHFVLGDSREKSTIDSVKRICGDRKPDLLFIDTHHTYEQMTIELELWKEVAGDNTRWMFHDTYMMGEYNHMTDAIKEFAEKNGYEYRDVSTEAHGLGMMTKSV